MKRLAARGGSAPPQLCRCALHGYDEELPNTQTARSIVKAARGYFCSATVACCASELPSWRKRHIEPTRLRQFFSLVRKRSDPTCEGGLLAKHIGLTPIFIRSPIGFRNSQYYVHHCRIIVSAEHILADQASSVGALTGSRSNHRYVPATI